MNKDYYYYYYYIVIIINGKLSAHITSHETQTFKGREIDSVHFFLFAKCCTALPADAAEIFFCRGKHI